MTEVDRKTLAEHLGMTTQALGKWVKKGTLDNSIVPNTKNKKFYLEIAVKNIQGEKKRDTHNSKSLSISKPPKDGSDEVRKKLGLSKQREQEIISEINDGLEDLNQSTEHMPKSAKNNKDINNKENNKELKDLLDKTTSPTQKVTITKDFWLGKLNRQKFLKEEGELITVKDAKGIIEVMFSPLSRKLDDIHIDLKSRYPDTSMEAVGWLYEYVNDIKKSVSEHRWN